MGEPAGFVLEWTKTFAPWQVYSREFLDALSATLKRIIVECEILATTPCLFSASPNSPLMLFARPCMGARVSRRNSICSASLHGLGQHCFWRVEQAHGQGK